MAELIVSAEYEVWKMFWSCNISVNKMLRAVKAEFITEEEFESITGLNFEEELKKDRAINIELDK